MYDAVVQHRGNSLEMTVLTESMFFACLYVVSFGLSQEAEGAERLSDAERYIRTVIVQAYEELFQENTEAR